MDCLKHVKNPFWKSNVESLDMCKWHPVRPPVTHTPRVKCHCIIHYPFIIQFFWRSTIFVKQMMLIASALQCEVCKTSNSCQWRLKKCKLRANLVLHCTRQEYLLFTLNKYISQLPVHELHFFHLQILWTFSIYLEAVAILPQLVLLQQTQNIDNLTGNYVFLLGYLLIFLFPQSVVFWVSFPLSTSGIAFAKSCSMFNFHKVSSVALQ